MTGAAAVYAGDAIGMLGVGNRRFRPRRRSPTGTPPGAHWLQCGRLVVPDGDGLSESANRIVRAPKEVDVARPGPRERCPVLLPSGNSSATMTGQQEVPEITECLRVGTWRRPRSGTAGRASTPVSPALRGSAAPRGWRILVCRYLENRQRSRPRPNGWDLAAFRRGVALITFPFRYCPLLRFRYVRLGSSHALVLGRSPREG